jgi:cytochrome b561
MSTDSGTARLTRSLQRYTLGQMLLHWSIAALVLWQLFVSANPNKAAHMLRRGLTPGAADTFLAASHIWIGFAILALAIVRVVLRLRRPTPQAEEPNRLIAALARHAHNLFYALLFFMPITGILSYYFGLPTGGIHELGGPVFTGLIAVHAAAAFWHQFIRRDHLLLRMLVPTKA